MKRSMTNIIKIASVYIGTVLGAGFASGQEMLKFFAAYGLNGMYGIIVTGLLFTLIGWAVLEMVYVYKIKSYREFIYPMMGEFLGSIMEVTVSVFMLICFCAMLAGSGALLEQRFHLPYQAGVILMALLCFLTFLYDVKGVIAINTVLAPVLFIGGIILGINIIAFRKVETFTSVIQVFKIITDNWVTSATVYVSYNTVTSVVVLTSLYKLIDSKRTAILSSVIAGFALCVLGLCLGVATLLYYGKIRGVEIPMLEIVMYYAPVIQYIYLFVLISAMFTTAVANGYGFITRMASIVHMKQKQFLMFFIFGSIIIAQFGFSNLVRKIYPIFGYVGIFEVILILLYFIAQKVNILKVKFIKRFLQRLNKLRKGL